MKPIEKNTICYFNNHTLPGGWLALFVAAIIVDAGHLGGGITYRQKQRGSKQ
ncbi:MAG: hypothetical protein WCS96_08795 [Victivallales bacterium]